MSIQPKQIQIASEVDDILILLASIVKDLRAGKDASSVISSNVPLLVAAVSGLDQAQTELQQHPDVVAATVGLRVGSIVGEFLVAPVKVVPAPSA